MHQMPVGFYPAGMVTDYPVRPRGLEVLLEEEMEQVAAGEEEEEVSERGEAQAEEVRREGAEGKEAVRAEEEREQGEERRPKSLTDVPSPSREQREAHYLSGHAMYRPWCQHCVNGRGRTRYHKELQEIRTDEVPLVGID